MRAEITLDSAESLILIKYGVRDFPVANS
jgi:hypothetical protein